MTARTRVHQQQREEIVANECNRNKSKVEGSDDMEASLSIIMIFNFVSFVTEVEYK